MPAPNVRFSRPWKAVFEEGVEHGLQLLAHSLIQSREHLHRLGLHVIV